MPPRTGIRNSLAWLVTAAIVPIIAFSVWMAWTFIADRRAATEAELDSTARALMVTVDRELDSQLKTMDMLGTAHSLDRNDFDSFTDRARRAIDEHPEWLDVVLIDPRSQAIVAGARPIPVPKQISSAPEAVEKVVATGQPLIVGAFAKSKIIGRPMILLMAPVVRNGGVRFVLSVVLDPAVFNSIFNQQRLPPSWTGAVIDGDLKIAGRSRSPEQYVGNPVTSLLGNRIAAAESGMFAGKNQEGDKVYSVFSRSSVTGWTVGLGIPAEEFDGPMRHRVMVIGAAGAVLTALALGLAVVVGRGIVARRLDFERAITKVSTRYQSLLKAAVDGIHILDKDGNLVEASDSFYRMLGYTREQMVSLNVRDWDAFYAPEAFDDRMKDHFSEPSSFETRHRRADGSVFDVEINVQAIEIEGQMFVYCASRDITERNSAQAMLNQERNFIRSTIDSLPGVFYVINENGGFALWNSNLEAITGYTAEELTAVPALSLFDGDDRDLIAASIARVFKEGQIEAEASLVGKTGVRIPHYFSGRRLLSDDGVKLVGMGIDISERKLAELRLRESEERFRCLVDETSDWAWETDIDHCFSLLSVSSRCSFVAPPETMLGKRRWDLASPERDIDATQWQAHMQDLGNHRSFRNFRYWIRTADGHAKWLSVSGTPRFDGDGRFLGYRGTSSDVTAEANTALRLKMLSTAVEQSPISVVITDPDANIVYVNSHFTTVSGYAADEVIGQNSRMFASGETSIEVYQDLWGTIAAGQRWTGELRNRRKGGEPYWEAVVIAPVLNDDQRIAHYVAIKEDVSERRALHDKLRQTNAELEQFAYVASHDMRQPLRMVTSYLGLIEKRLAPESLTNDIEKYLGFAVAGAKRMDSMIVGLLEYSRTGKSGEKEAVPLADAVADALTNLTVAIREAGAEVIVANDLPTINGNATELTRLFQNLVGNAVKYHAPGRRPEVDIGWKRQGDEWLISVRDNGIGIAAEDCERVFGIFQRLVPHDAYEGTGIGLAVCKKIVEHHGGRIWIEPLPSEGTIFFFTLQDCSAAT